MANRKPNTQFKDVSSLVTLPTLALLIATLSLGMMVMPVFADAPVEGVVREGESVPGIALGTARAQVASAYGEPDACQDVEVGGDLAWCRYPVEGGGNVSVWYQGADGRYASNSPDDTAYRIQWPKAVSGWTTTAGINTELAFNDRQAVVDAYPNAVVTYNENGRISQVEELQLGIRVKWFEPVYIFTEGTVTMEIFMPVAALAEGSSIHVAGIDITGEKIKNRRPVVVTVSILGEQGQPVYGATVVGTWTYPHGATQTVEEGTSYTGYAFFGLYDAGNGNWTLTIEDVLLDGHPLDRNKSTLSVTFDAKRFK